MKNRYKVTVCDVVKITHDNPAIANIPFKRIAIFDSILNEYICDPVEYSYSSMTKLNKRSYELNLDSTEFMIYDENLNSYLNE